MTAASWADRILRVLDAIQSDYMNHVYTGIRDGYEWIIYVDVDEFITTRKNPGNTIRDELLSAFAAADCVKIPWVMMGSNGLVKSPSSILVTNVYRWNHDLRHPHPNSVHKFRCRYDAIEVKCIFRAQTFSKISDHCPRGAIREQGSLSVVSGIDGAPAPLSQFVQNLREEQIEGGFLLCYHYRIISVENSIQKLKTNAWYRKLGLSLDDLMLSDYSEIRDDTLRNKRYAQGCE
jgi:hypothetical protein